MAIRKITAAKKMVIDLGGWHSGATGSHAGESGWAVMAGAEITAKKKASTPLSYFYS